MLMVYFCSIVTQWVCYDTIYAKIFLTKIYVDSILNHVDDKGSWDFAIELHSHNFTYSAISAKFLIKHLFFRYHHPTKASNFI